MNHRNVARQHINEVACYRPRERAREREGESEREGAGERARGGGEGVRVDETEVDRGRCHHTGLIAFHHFGGEEAHPNREETAEHIGCPESIGRGDSEHGWLCTCVADGRLWWGWE